MASSGSIIVRAVVILACAAVPSTRSFTPFHTYTSHASTRKNLSDQSNVFGNFRTTVSQLNSVEVTPFADETMQISTKSLQTRTLGSQELLMLPRQYKPGLEKGDKPFPQMSHVSTVILSSTPSVEVLSQAIDEAMASHPLLRCYVQGDGEPSKRIDLFQMVREGNPNPCTFVCPPIEESSCFSSRDVLSVIDVKGNNRDVLDSSWKDKFSMNLDSGSDWCNVEQGPLWKVELHRLADGGKDSPCALMFTFNHAISDQSSANLLMEHIVKNMADIEQNGYISNKAILNKIPSSMEDSVLGVNRNFANVETQDFSLDTVTYVAGKAAEGFYSPVILPDDQQSKDDGNGMLGALTIITGNVPGGESLEERKSTVQFRSLCKETTYALVEKCRERGLTMSNVLSAAIALTASDFIDGGKKKGDISRNYKVLQSLDMRRFGAALDKCESVSCMAGSHDLMLGPIPDRSGKRVKVGSGEMQENIFWSLARESRKQTNKFIESGGPQQATRVFDFAMTISDMNNLVSLSAKSNESKGRAYSAGIVNAGVFEKQNAVRREGKENREKMVTKHGRYILEEIYFATSHARSGCLYQASCMTINDRLHCTFHPAMPIVNEVTNSDFADSFVDLLEVIAGTKVVKSEDYVDRDSLVESTLSLLRKAPVVAASLYGIYGISSHAGAWSNFFHSVFEMKEAVSNPADFWAALNFWIFFAVGHPLLRPILWISDVLHGTPGPKVADLVPVLFLIGNAVVIAAVTASKEIRNGLNIFALAAFLSYVGAGLDGKAGLGDFNLALDDSYAGKAVKGCPTYDQVRQKSMDNFDLTKYQGLWYEHKFHDWTQFKEVYDTTLDIKVCELKNPSINFFF